MSDYKKASELVHGLSKQLQEGNTLNLRGGIQLPHFPIFDTGLAACLATLDIPLRNPGAFTEEIELDARGNETGRKRVCWWLADLSQDHPEIPQEKRHKTEELCGAWDFRERFEKEHPLHPLVHMRAALDARKFWVETLSAYRDGRATLPIETSRTPFYITDSLHGASVLKANGFQPLAFSGRAFLLQSQKDGMPAQQLLAIAAQMEGQAPPQWMSRVLKNYGEMVKVTKNSSPIIRQNFGDGQHLLLTADATRQTRDKFFSQIQ
jgi:hypothetical protein